MSDFMNRVSHVNRSKTGMTKLQISIPIGMRASLSEASSRLQMSQLAIIRAAILSWLLDHGGWEAWDRPPVPTGEVPGPEMVPTAVSELVQPAAAPVVDSELVPEQVSTIESGMDTVLESVVKETTVVPEQAPATKRPRGKKGGQS